MFSRKNVFVAFVALEAFAGISRADTFKIDPVHSTVIFRISHLGTSEQYGRFNGPTGTLEVSNGELTGVNAQVPVANLDTGNKKREEDVKGPDFFSAKEFPNVTFKSATVKKISDNTYEVTGDITIHGVTKPITATVEKTGQGKGMTGRDIIGFETTFTIKRSDFGVKGLMGPVGDDVRVTFATEADKS
jgi:polyisoprenoid-binding protein YceI